ncbi:MAG: hypothetical protein U5L04_06305 [Trueperaceae bacterium]|nr:hypothetical protein [Trueperaceae bacterium]
MSINNSVESRVRRNSPTSSEARRRRCRVNAPECRTSQYCTVCKRNQYRLCWLGRNHGDA